MPTRFPLTEDVASALATDDADADARTDD